MVSSELEILKVEDNGPDDRWVLAQMGKKAQRNRMEAIAQADESTARTAGAAKTANAATQAPRRSCASCSKTNNGGKDSPPSGKIRPRAVGNPTSAPESVLQYEFC